jgi:glycosyltransferase involved in cell wall biosynthesis
MRILQVVPTYLPAYRYGGPIRSVHGLSCALVQRGHDVEVYTTSMDGPQDLDVPLGQPVSLDGVKVTYFPVPCLRRLAWAPALSRRLQETIRSFDVVHLHSVFLWPTWAAARAARRARRPYVLSPRGMLGKDLIRRKSRWVKTAWIRLVERRNIASAAGLHVTTELEAAEVRAWGFNFPEIICIPNGIQRPSRCAALSEGPFANLPRPYALFLSRISWKKGIERLIRAWAMVSNLYLVIAGNDEDNYLPTLKTLVQELGLTARVLFTGPLADTDKWAVYENAEMFVLPSYSENFGNVVAEAMIMSCPVIVTPEVGLAETVREFGAGLITSGEPQDLAAKIYAIQANPDIRREMGNRGFRAASKIFAWDVVASRVEAMYLRSLKSVSQGTIPT